MPRLLIHSIICAAQFIPRAIAFLLDEPRTSWLLVRMIGWVAIISLLMKFLSRRRALRLINPRTRFSEVKVRGYAPSRLAQLLDMVLAIDTLFLTPTCWKREPILFRYLALSGVESCIVFGVRKNERETLAGHAWLEVGGQPICGTRDPNYTPTNRFPA